jgi:hypothetical protein
MRPPRTIITFWALPPHHWPLSPGPREIVRRQAQTGPPGRPGKGPAFAADQKGERTLEPFRLDRAGDV